MIGKKHLKDIQNALGYLHMAVQSLAARVHVLEQENAKLRSAPVIDDYEASVDRVLRIGENWRTDLPSGEGL
jgi:hypothetical protein